MPHSSLAYRKMRQKTMEFYCKTNPFLQHHQDIWKQSIAIYQCYCDFFEFSIHVSLLTNHNIEWVRPMGKVDSSINLKTSLRLIVFKFRPSKERPPRSLTLLKLRSRYSRAKTFFNSHFESVKILLFERSSFRNDAQSLKSSLLIELLWFSTRNLCQNCDHT